MGHLDADGFVFLSDRKNDLIVRGGENISPREVEDALLSYPAVASVAVVGARNREYGEEVVAFVVPPPGHRAAAGALREFCRARLARIKVPRRFEFVAICRSRASARSTRRGCAPWRTRTTRPERRSRARRHAGCARSPSARRVLPPAAGPGAGAHGASAHEDPCTRKHFELQCGLGPTSETASLVATSRRVRAFAVARSCSPFDTLALRSAAWAFSRSNGLLRRRRLRLPRTAGVD